MTGAKTNQMRFLSPNDRFGIPFARNISEIKLAVTVIIAELNAQEPNTIPLLPLGTTNNI